MEHHPLSIKARKAHEGTEVKLMRFTSVSSSAKRRYIYRGNESFPFSPFPYHTKCLSLQTKST
jgi:hypothetical protein